MSGKLDQTLDEITAAQRRTTRRRASGRRSTTGRPAATAPAGGIQKNTKPARGGAIKSTPARAVASGDSKVIVSNLPKDVTEKQIKEYFVQSVGPIKRVELVYGPNSQSRGIANVTFSRADGATTALGKLNGLLVDGRPIKIEVVVSAAQANQVIPQAKTLAERTSQPKSQPKAQPKSAANKQNTGAGKGDAGKGQGKRRGRAANPRPAKKSEAELDSDMADYFGSAPNENAAASAPAAATGGDAAMEDEIM